MRDHLLRAITANMWRSQPGCYSTGSPECPSTCHHAGNILLLLGFPFIIGFKRTLVFFNPIRRKDKWRGIVLFFLGIALVLRKNTFIGFILESIGMFAMFGAFLPIVVQFLRNTPFIGPIFSAPGVSSVVDKIAGVARRPPV